jgi:hydroxyacylglutathione hydrolase
MTLAVGSEYEGPMKRVLIGLAAFLLILVIAAGVLFYVAFGSNQPIVDGQELAPEVHVVKDGLVSLVILDVAPGKVALVDCGNDKAGKAILGALTGRGLTPEAVVAIFLTHGHPDHVAGCKLFPKAEVYALENEVPVIGEAAQVTHRLHDGEVSEVGSLRMETFAVPGHTPGSAVFLARGVLFFGDSAGGGKDGDLHPALRLLSKSPEQNKASLKALASRLQPRAAEVKTLEFAHTGPLEGLGPLSAFAAGQPGSAQR